MILCVTLNPIIDKNIYIDYLEKGKSAHSSSIQLIAGGKGNNVARVLQKFGINVMALNLLGGFEGKQLKNILENEHLPNVCTWIKGKTRNHLYIIEKNSKILTDIYEPSPDVSKKEKKLFLKKYRQLAIDSELVVLGGSSPCRELDDTFYEMIDYANKNEIKSILDTSGNALASGIEAMPFLVKPNIEETEKITGKRIENINEIIKALDFYNSKKIRMVVISMGKNGAYIRSDKNIFKSSTPDIPALNPFGSGDCMVAGFIKGIVEGLDIVDTIKIAMAAGTANVTRWDVAAITLDEIEKYIPKIKVEKIV
jgi:1-phosphofructokinase family hexose kinase